MPALNIHIPITPTLVFALFALLMAMWLVYTIILRYHWKNYTIGKLSAISMNLIYLVGSGILLAGAGLFALMYWI